MSEGVTVRPTAAQLGVTDGQWATAKHQVRAAVLAAAYDRRMTWYGEVAARVDAISLDPRSALLGHLLDAVFEDEYAAGGPALTSIVTHGYGDREPAPAFYAEARALGYRFTEPLAFWTEEVRKVFAEYGEPAGLG
jgi:hypothetical protein